jgi:hypothetical protein
MAQGAVRAEGAAHDVLVTHRTLNVGLFATALAMTAARARGEPGPLYLLAGLGAMAAMSWSAYLGGKMVYEHGVGVEAAGGVRRDASPEIVPGRIGHAARVAVADAAQAIADASRDLRAGQALPLFSTSPRS